MYIVFKKILYLLEYIEISKQFYYKDKEFIFICNQNMRQAVECF